MKKYLTLIFIFIASISSLLTYSKEASYYEFENKGKSYVILKISNIFEIKDYLDIEPLKKHCHQQTFSGANWRLINQEFPIRYFIKKDNNVRILDAKGKVINGLVGGANRRGLIVHKQNNQGKYKRRENRPVSIAPICIANVFNGKIAMRAGVRPKLAGIDFNGRINDEFNINPSDIEQALKVGMCTEEKFKFNLSDVKSYINHLQAKKVRKLYGNKYRLVRIDDAKTSNWFNHLIKQKDLSSIVRVKCTVRNPNNAQNNAPGPAVGPKKRKTVADLDTNFSKKIRNYSA